MNSDVYTEHAHEVFSACYAPSGFYICSGGMTHGNIVLLHALQLLLYSSTTCTLISSLYDCMAIKYIIVLFVETPRKFITAKLYMYIAVHDQTWIIKWQIELQLCRKPLTLWGWGASFTIHFSFQLQIRIFTYSPPSFPLTL